MDTSPKMPSLEEIAVRIDALGLWDVMAPYNWAVRPAGIAFPYFCSILKGDGNPVIRRLLLLEGWQTMHDFVRTRIDQNFGVCSSPSELPHYELVYLNGGESGLYRHDPGFVPRKADERERSLCAKMLWEAYGVMMRVEADRSLPMKFADEKSIFARVEDASGVWSDAPLEVPDPRPYVETVSLDAKLVAKAKDLPMDASLSWEVDFRIIPFLQTGDRRPRSVYGLVAVDSLSGEKRVNARRPIDPEAGLKAMWESVPSRMLEEIVAFGRVPGEIKLVSARLFRFMRALCLELPFKLSLHDSLPKLDAAFAQQ